MKKIISLVLVFILILSSLTIIVSAQESVNMTITIENGAVLAEVFGLFDKKDQLDNTQKATGLIVSKLLKLSKTTDELIITATTIGASNVDKCGFTYVTLQRRVNGAWTNYKTYIDQYNNSNSKTFSKNISAPRGYTYRLICEHYAEKTRLLFLTESETSYNVTTSLSF